jgi:hypothetical protein
MKFPESSAFDGAFDPAAAMRMQQAFVRAWEYMKESGEVARAETESARACLALLVLDLGREGEENVTRLTNLAIARFRRYQASTSFRKRCGRRAESASRSWG